MCMYVVTFQIFTMILFTEPSELDTHDTIKEKIIILKLIFSLTQMQMIIAYKAFRNPYLIVYLTRLEFSINPMVDFDNKTYIDTSKL